MADAPKKESAVLKAAGDFTSNSYGSRQAEEKPPAKKQKLYKYQSGKSE
jgi:hypothetical protein